MLSAWGLTKAYGGRTVVDQVGFELQPGTVTAFLGPNGAGKSTTLRMITGLTMPDRGQAMVAGRPFTAWPNPSHVAGVLLDAAAVHPGRSGRGHLRTAAMLAGVPSRRADEVLETVGLADAATRKIGKYSLGMRQRLGIAHALLTNPPLLILDEPINGLDPEGIRAVRNLLRGHAARGGTVLLSSHVLSEVDQTADRVLVIGNGRIVADGPLASLTTSSRSLVRAKDMNRLAEALQRGGIAIQPAPDGFIAAHAPVERVSDVTFAAGIPLLGLREEQMNLEDLFFRLTGGGRPA
ncbi:ATP-binding cassette domain-containing protein [Lentzea flava]|uniref:ABC transporter n=1 Tax=Lentzea flava TaxID=103732 RepID=A0ABQ2UF77_9PSEU|nr:ATP-binding cassette domain-containing protein [Lentzea flava]MCP2197770.1 ABC-2 type transport system ATP-binding protein [Lentzea flava]GGU22054.1 ABC transporter [Lentzea flava]